MIFLQTDIESLVASGKLILPNGYEPAEMGEMVYGNYKYWDLTQKDWLSIPVCSYGTKVGPDWSPVVKPISKKPPVKWYMPVELNKLNNVNSINKVNTLNTNLNNKKSKKTKNSRKFAVGESVFFPLLDEFGMVRDIKDGRIVNYGVGFDNNILLTPTQYMVECPDGYVVVEENDLEKDLVKF